MLYTSWLEAVNVLAVYKTFRAFEFEVNIRENRGAIKNRVSDWLLFNVKWVIFIYTIVRSSYISMSNAFNWIFIVLIHWNNSPQVDMSLHSDTFLWLWAKQSLLLPLSAEWWAENQQKRIWQSLVWPHGVLTHAPQHTNQ